MKSIAPRHRALPRTISAFNSADRLPFAFGDLQPGVIHQAANDSRFGETYFSEPLTTFSTGYKDPNDIKATLEFFAPTVNAPGRLFEWKKWNNAEEFYTEADDIRAIGGDFKRVEFTGIDVVGKTLNKGLTVRIDIDQAAPGWEERWTAKLIRRLYRNELRRAIALLSAAATNTAKTWDVTAGKDPDQDVLTDLIAGNDASGIYPNRVGFGHTAWAKRILAHRAQLSAGGFASAGVTQENLAGFLNVDQVYVSKERYQSTPAAKAQAVGNLVLMFMAASGGDVEDPSNIKRFASPVMGGGQMRVYQQQVSAKLVDISVEYYSALVMTSTLGVRQFTVS
jgi:hypothetical protein